MQQMLKLAGKVAMPSNPDEELRNFYIGCIGIRDDGVLVSAKNGAVFSTTTEHYQKLPSAHAEGRVLRKLGHNGTMYVSRVAKSNGDYAMSMPCPICQVRIKSFNVRKVVYTINKAQFGVWNVKKDIHKVYEM